MSYLWELPSLSETDPETWDIAKRKKVEENDDKDDEQPDNSQVH